MREQSGIGTYADRRLGDKLWALRKFFISQYTDFCETEVVSLYWSLRLTLKFIFYFNSIRHVY